HICENESAGRIHREEGTRSPRLSKRPDASQPPEGALVWAFGVPCWEGLRLLDVQMLSVPCTSSRSRGIRAWHWNLHFKCLGRARPLAIWGCQLRFLLSEPAEGPLRAKRSLPASTALSSGSPPPLQITVEGPRGAVPTPDSPSDSRHRSPPPPAPVIPASQEQGAEALRWLNGREALFQESEGPQATWIRVWECLQTPVGTGSSGSALVLGRLSSGEAGLPGARLRSEGAGTRHCWLVTPTGLKAGAVTSRAPGPCVSLGPGSLERQVFIQQREARLLVWTPPGVPSPSSACAATVENGSGPGSPSAVSLVPSDAVPSPEYKMVSVFLVFLVCVVGIVGNAMVVLTTRDMHMPTNGYLVSLALADLTVLVAAGLPTVSKSLAGQWVCGHAGCLGITCLRYLGIRASNSSVPAFAAEREAVCVVAGVWGTTSVYCLFWFFLVALDAGGHRGPQPAPAHLPAGLHRLLRYALLEATVLYSLIGRVLLQSSPAHLPQLGDQLGGQHGGGEDWPEPGTQGRQLCGPGRVTPMLVVVVPLFAVLWMPYRTLVLLYSFVARAFLDPWGLLFCRTCVYTNSAINPNIYSLTSPKFRLPSSGCAGEGWRIHRGARLASAPPATAWTPEDADPRDPSRLPRFAPVLGPVRWWLAGPGEGRHSFANGSSGSPVPSLPMNEDWSRVLVLAQWLDSIWVAPSPLL
ncbi:hypothetical protein EI555_017004, partial [Monodon monoceros]